MRKTNRKRRDDGRRRRHNRRKARQGGPTTGQSTGQGSSRQSLDDAVAAVMYAGIARPHELPWLLDQLTQSFGHDGGAQLAQVLTGRLERAVAACWEHGWQPADLAHVVGRRRRPAHRQLCGAAIGYEARSYRHASGADPAWLAQVDAVSPSAVSPDDGGPGDDAPSERTAPLDGMGHQPQSSADDPIGLLGSGGDLREAILVAVETLAEIYSLPSQPRLCPPPSEWGRGPRMTGAASARPRSSSGAPDPKVTERVRALLAKAESTDFPDEAEAFTAKAQELIARHAIDVAMLQGQPDDRSGAVGRRILLDDPYAKAKGLLLAEIASANHCRTVRSQHLGISTVFGAPNDIDAVELLYTSLLAQATAAMVTAGRAGSRERSRGFRSTFLVAYATRIGERLRQATSVAVDDARTTHGDNVLPVLASRKEAATEARNDAFPNLKRERTRATDAAGWLAGTAAADQAHLGPKTALTA